MGDPEGDIKRAFSHFPFQDVAARIWESYFVPGGKEPEKPFKPIPMASVNPPRALTELMVLANFTEVFLAKEGHNGVVGINFLEKIQLPNLAQIFGAMLAGVDYVLMGAGIPRAIPGILDNFSQGKPAKLKLDVEQALPGEEFACALDPESFFQGQPSQLKRPNFLAIISSAVLALSLSKKSSGKVDGFIVEGATAGGHNAPPRGTMQYNAIGEPVYGERDTPELEKIKAIGLPFWLAGSFGQTGKLSEALSLGATGVQVGTAFAFCEESAIAPELKRKVVEKSKTRSVSVFTDPVASPTGFPFKVLQLEGTMSDPQIYADRPRICDLGYLRHPYRKEDGSLGYRCPSEPVKDYVRKGGALEETVGRKCLCNGLLATVELPQKQASGYTELPIMTAGDEVANVAQFLKPGADTYTAADVIDFLTKE
jgi:NAD(P)H-dependent flavin oxidoreductase YrpB (nitropropane dioxygenase family)